MATNKVPSMPEWVGYMEAQYQEAFKADYKANSKALGYPGKDEIGMVDDPKVKLTAAHTLTAIPGAIGSYMADTGRGFALPAPNDKTAPATLKTVDVEKKTKTGTVMLGDKKGETYKSTIAAHAEPKVSVNRKSFKK